MKGFNMKKCGVDMGCWSGFAGVLGVAFIIVATILTLLTMNGLGILGMFFVGVMLCRRKMVMCPCCHAHHMHGEDDADCVVESKPKVNANSKVKPKKETVKK